VAGRRVYSVQIRKTAACRAYGKEVVADTEDKAIVGIPLVVRLGIVPVEPRLTVLIALDLEDLRVAVTIGIVRCAIPSIAGAP